MVLFRVLRLYTVVAKAPEPRKLYRDLGDDPVESNWHSAVYAVIGIVLAVLMAIGFSLIPVRSGDKTIEPEGERDPGRFGYPARITEPSEK